MSLADTYNNKLKNVFHIQVPDKNGNMQYVKRIYKGTVAKENIIWQQKSLTYTFRDNIPVTVTYDMNNTTVVKTSAPEQKITEDTMWLVPIGNINYTNKILNGFTTANYARTPIAINWTTTSSFELLLKIKTGSNVNTRQELFSMTNTESIELEILNCRLHWEKCGKYGNSVLSTNTVYFVKVVKQLAGFRVYLSTDGTNYSLDIDSTANFNVSNEWMHFGIDKVCGGTTVEPFLGTIDLSQSTFLYGNILYHISMHDDNYMLLVRDNNITVTNQVISNFYSKAYYIRAAHTPVYFSWSQYNSFELCLNVNITDIKTSQLIATWRTINKNDICVNDIRIQNGYLEYEYSVAESRLLIPSKGNYYVIFSKTNNIAYLELYTSTKKLIASRKITILPNKNINQYLYLGVEEDAELTSTPWTGWIFKGTIDCNGSYVELNKKKYNFRI